MRARNARQPQPSPEMPVRITEDGTGTPVAMRSFGTWVEVETVESERHTRGLMMGDHQVVKSHYVLVLADGSRVEVFKNHVTGGWHTRG